MKRFIVTAAALLISTAAVADQSDRYKDLRLDTSISGASFATTEHLSTAGKSTRYKDLRLGTQAKPSVKTSRFSTRGTSTQKTKGEGFIYGGFGPGNDSR